MTEPPATSTADLMLTVSEEHTQHWEQRALAAEAEVDRLRDDLADVRRVNAEAWRRIETAREIAVRHHADSFPALRGGRWRWEQVITALSGTDDAALSVGGTDRTEGDDGD